MSPWAAVATAVALGWGVWRASARWSEPLPAFVAIPLWGVVGTVAWLVLLDLAGAPWAPVALLLPAAAATLAVLASPPRPGRTGASGWAVAAACAAVSQAVLVAARPAFGWDFRYIWGLRGLVFAHAGSHATPWLAWFPNHWLHPDYPPAWPDLLAAGVTLGGDVRQVAAWWSALCVLGLAAACWQLAAPAPLPLRALAAVTGAWAPVLWAPSYSGYAEPLLAFLSAAALAMLPGALRGQPAPLIAAASAAAGLAVTKNEGMALALGLALAAAWRGSRRAALTMGGAALAAILAWRAFLAAFAVPLEPRVLAPAVVVRQLGELLRWLTHTVPALDLALLAAWLVVVALLLRARAAALVVVGVWGAAVVAAYATTEQGVAWQLTTSLDRVLAAPLPAALACALGLTWSGAARPRPGS